MNRIWGRLVRVTGMEGGPRPSWSGLVQLTPQGALTDAQQLGGFAAIVAGVLESLVDVPTA